MRPPTPGEDDVVVALIVEEALRLPRPLRAVRAHHDDRGAGRGGGGGGGGRGRAIVGWSRGWAELSALRKGAHMCACGGGHWQFVTIETKIYPLAECGQRKVYEGGDLAQAKPRTNIVGGCGRGMI